MTTEHSVKTGADILFTTFQQPAGGGVGPIFGTVDISSFLDEAWSSAPYADNVGFRSTSAEGSRLTLLKSANTANGIEMVADDFSFSGSDGSRLTYKSSMREPAGNGFGVMASSLSLDWSFVGDSKAKSDDVKVSAKISANDTLSAYGQGWKFSGGSSFFFSFGEGANGRQLVLRGNDAYTTIGIGRDASVDDNTTTFSLVYSDTTERAPFKFSVAGTLTNDLVANTSLFSWKSASVQVGAMKIDTKIFSGNTYSALDLGSLLDVDNVTALLRDRWLALLAKGNNVFTGGSASDTMEASDGNDSLSGNRGDDFLNGGAGTDQLAGGAGSDVFIFSVGDSAVSASTADQIKDFKVAEGDQVSLTGVSVVNCEVSRTKAASFDMAVAAANAAFGSGNNVSIQFLAKNAVMLVDMDGNAEADLAVMLVGLKAGDTRLSSYAESGAMFA